MLERRNGPFALKAVRPNAGLASAYQRQIERLVDAMHASVYWWLRAAYRREQDRIEGSASIAEDAAPAAELAKIIAELRRRWLRRFDEGAQELARYFAKAIVDRNDAELRKILKRAGFTVNFTLTQPIRDALKAIVQESVSLIKSIPAHYLDRVEGDVMRSVVAGRDLQSLTQALEEHYRVSRNRAELIAKHQNNWATGAIQRLRYLDIGVERAIWRHSGAGKEPRPTHVANDKHEYDVRTGWFDPHEQQFVFPGQLVNCRCWSQPLLPS